MTPRRRRALALGALFALAVGAAGAEEAAAPTQRPEAPSAIVDALHACLLGVMQESQALGYRGRYERLDPVLKDLFDLDFMAQKAVGRYWKTASPEDQERLEDTFTRYTVSNYAGRFDRWSGQHFETLGEEESARGTVLVRTVLVDPDGEDVKLDYRLRSTDAGWRIIDVYLNGTVSELALRRSEYSALIKRGGFEALLVALDERIEELASQSPADRGI